MKINEAYKTVENRAELARNPGLKMIVDLELRSLRNIKRRHREWVKRQQEMVK